MKSLWAITFVVLNFSLFILYMVGFGFAVHSEGFTSGLPWILPGFFALVSGIVTIKKDKWGCGCAGLFISILIGIVVFSILVSLGQIEFL
jgi:hypothetical protein